MIRLDHEEAKQFLAIFLNRCDDETKFLLMIYLDYVFQSNSIENCVLIFDDEYDALGIYNQLDLELHIFSCVGINFNIYQFMESIRPFKKKFTTIYVNEDLYPHIQKYLNILYSEPITFYRTNYEMIETIPIKTIFGKELPELNLAYAYQLVDHQIINLLIGNSIYTLIVNDTDDFKHHYIQDKMRTLPVIFSDFKPCKLRNTEINFDSYFIHRMVPILGIKYFNFIRYYSENDISEFYKATLRKLNPNYVFYYGDDERMKDVLEHFKFKKFMDKLVCFNGENKKIIETLKMNHQNYVLYRERKVNVSIGWSGIIITMFSTSVIYLLNHFLFLIPIGLIPFVHIIYKRKVLVFHKKEYKYSFWFTKPDIEMLLYLFINMLLYIIIVCLILFGRGLYEGIFENDLWRLFCLYNQSN